LSAFWLQAIDLLMLVVGLVIFLGTHMLRVITPAWRERMIVQLGVLTWRILISIASLVGLVLLIWGFAQARLTSPMLWVPPYGMRHVAALLTLIAFILLASFFIPRNAISVYSRYPVTLSVAVWAVAHLLANGRLVDIVLFGSCVLWAYWEVVTLRKGNSDNLKSKSPTVLNYTIGATVLTLGVGVVAWAVFLFWFHLRLIGLAPLSWSL
jgi:uncharacterized membrane protein